MDLLKIDALIAKHVLKIDGATFDHDGDHLPKPYSSDIRAAWEVVQKIKCNGALKIVSLGGSFAVTNLHEDFWEIYDPALVNGGDFFFKSESAPLAICLAALKSVGVEVK